MKASLALLIAFLLAGCGPKTWVKPGAKGGERSETSRGCELEAERKFPTEYREVEESEMRPGGDMKPKEYASRDVNKDDRKSEYERCMESKGWRQERR